VLEDSEGCWRDFWIIQDVGLGFQEGCLVVESRLEMQGAEVMMIIITEY
jgi:hypothetical protein